MHKISDKSIRIKLLALFFIFLAFSLYQVRLINQLFDRSAKEAYSQNIYYELSNYLSGKYKGGKILAKDEFLINWLQVEDDREALNAFLKEKTALLECSAIDIVASRSLTAYQSAGTIETIEEDDDADHWYYDLIKSGEKSNNEIYYDLNAGVLYIYLNEVVYSEDDEILGVLGLLIKYSDLASLLVKYQQSGVIGYLINDDGEIYLHPDQSKIGNVDIYDFFGYLQRADSEKQNTSNLEMDGKYIYKVDGLEGNLVVEIDHFYLHRIVLINTVIIIFILLFILFMIKGKTIRKN